jgi:hypothetical protein
LFHKHPDFARFLHFGERNVFRRRAASQAGARR